MAGWLAGWLIGVQVPVEAGINHVPFVGLNAGGIREIIQNHNKVVVNFSTVGELRTVRAISERLQEISKNMDRLEDYVPDVLSKMSTDKQDWIAFLHALHSNITDKQDRDRDQPEDEQMKEVHIQKAPLQTVVKSLEEIDIHIKEVYASDKHSEQTNASHGLYHSLAPLHPNHGMECDANPPETAYVVLYNQTKWNLHSNSEQHLAKHIGDFKQNTGVLPDAVITNAYDLQGRLVLAGFPFLLTQWKWLLCYPVMPLVLKAQALCEYLSTHRITSYNSTVLLDIGLWFHKKRKRVHQVQDAAFTLLDSIIYEQDCLANHMYTQGFQVTELHKPFSIRAIIGHQPDLTKVLEKDCGWTREDKLFAGWMDAAIAPVLCDVHAVISFHQKPQDRSGGLHLSKDYDAFRLKAVLAQHCGKTCVRHPSTAFGGGWQLVTGGCWMVVENADVCSEPGVNSHAAVVAEKKRWHGKPTHIRREHFDERHLPYVSATKLATSDNATCDMVQHGNQRVCGPQILLGGDHGCGVDAVARFLTAHRRITLRTCVDKSKQFCSQAQAFDGTYGSRSWAAVEMVEFHHTNVFSHMVGILPGQNSSATTPGRAPTRSSAHEIAETDGMNTLTFAFASPAHGTISSADAAQAALAALPHAKMVYMVCDPAVRLRHHFFAHDRQHRIPPDGKNASRFLKLVQELQICARDGITALGCRPEHQALLKPGMHAENLEPWLQHFKDRALVMDLGTILPLHDVNNLLQQTRAPFQTLLKHVGLPINEHPWPRLNSTLAELQALQPADAAIEGLDHDQSAKPLDVLDVGGDMQQAMELLAELYEGSNTRLAELIGKKFPLEWKPHGPSR